MDLNCAIYHCVKKLQKRLPYAPDIQARWESELIAQVLAYIRQLDAYVGATETLYIAVDGVAPMAKIKQQRGRRFKSAVAAEEEGRIRAHARGERYEAKPRWDTNAITPGTRFMGELATALRTFARAHPSRILVSPADEPGEGEQKIMNWIRSTKPGDVVVYGLDADLIVLALWATATTDIQVDLFREEVEFQGGVKEDALGEEQFLFMNMRHLGDMIYSRYSRKDQSPKERTQERADFLCDFVALMNLLGNDFVPHGMSLKIKDEGVETVLEIYGSSPALLTSDRSSYSVEGLRHMFKALAAMEETSMLRTVVKKLTARPGMTHSKDPEDIALAYYNDKPVLWRVEEALVRRVPVAGYERTQIVLRDDWRAMYDNMALWGANINEVVKAYLESLAWTLAYYDGKPVDMNWVYPWFLPPRFETIVERMEAMPVAPMASAAAVALKPLEQLAMVLPQSSFHLLPKEYAALPTLYPYAWPVEWEMFSLGRRFLWECEPIVPLVRGSQIRAWIDALYD